MLRSRMRAPIWYRTSCRFVFHAAGYSSSPASITNANCAQRVLFAAKLFMVWRSISRQPQRVTYAATPRGSIASSRNLHLHRVRSYLQPPTLDEPSFGMVVVGVILAGDGRVRDVDVLVSFVFYLFSQMPDG